MKNSIIPGIVIMLGFIIFGIIDYYLNKNKIEKLMEEYSVTYPSLSYQDEINSTVKSIFFGDPVLRKSTFTIYVDFQNEQKKTISAVTEPIGQHLLYNLKIGSLVLKAKNSSTFLLVDITKQDTIKYHLIDKTGREISKKTN
ncbi:hypothetical protein HNS38_00080 [Lentimicrobium sp. L6]|uniref:hypothetical protein n=1 Tax=Lentimicrobium sp. L6 TaxID=2735916 RepID=UPI001558048C|nr:hypothetical protein [Lentimicrobium sp. L6]NPD83137.1 hypothetical protein [Lentimicrobium sp. L6]